MLRPTVVFSPSPQPTPYTWPPTTGSLRKLAVSEETGSWYLKVVEPPTQPNTLVCSYLEPQRKYRSYLWRSCGRLGELYQGLQEREKKNPGPANTLLEPFELNEWMSYSRNEKPAPGTDWTTCVRAAAHFLVVAFQQHMTSYCKARSCAQIKLGGSWTITQ